MTTVYDLAKQATSRPWGHASGVVTCTDDGEHIGSSHTNTLVKNQPSLHRMNGTASAAYASHCCNNYLKALEYLKSWVQCECGECEWCKRIAELEEVK